MASSKSSALLAALACLKDNMTDSQKGHTLLKEAKSCADNDDFLGAIEIIAEGINYCPTIVSLYTVRANCYKSLHQYSNAYFDYSYCIRLEPENGSYYCSRGLILCKTKRIQLALEDLDYAIKIEPTPFHYFSRGTIYSDSLMYDNAILDYSRAIADTENISSELNIRALYRRALSYFDKADYNSTIDDIKTILSLDPAQNQSRALYAKTLKMLGDLREAEFEITQVIEADSSLASYFIERGDIRYRSKKYLHDAINDFDIAVNILEPKVNPESSLHTPHASMGGRRTSTSTNRSGVKKQMTNISSPTNKSKFVSDIRGLHAENTNGVEGFVEYKSEYEKHLADAYYKRAQAKLLLNDDTAMLESALNDSRSAFKLTPWDDDFRLLVGICYIKLEDYEKAIGVLHETITKIINPPLMSLSKHSKHDSSHLTPVGTMIKALYHSAYCNRHLGNNKEAIEDLTRVIIIADKMKPQAVEVSVDETPTTYDDTVAEQEFVETKACDNEQSAPELQENNEVESNEEMIEVAVDQVAELLPSATNIEEKGEVTEVPDNEESRPATAIEPEQTTDQIVVNLAAVDMTPLTVPVNNVGIAVVNGSHDIPLFKVYEMRGILFYEAHTYEFALKDFSKCIILDADNADVIYLRGECHFQLGNYELALEDFYETEEKKNFSQDLSALYTSRGIVLRLLGYSEEARRDFELAYDRLTNSSTDISVKASIRILNLHAMAFIDSRQYHEARSLLEQALDTLEGLLNDRISALPAPIIKPNPNPYAKVEPKQIVPRDVLQLIKSKWVTRYHIALTMYMLHQYHEAEELLVILIHNIQGNNKTIIDIDALPDDFAKGQCVFYLGMTSFKLGKYEEAITIYQEAIQSAWGRVVKNKMIALFAQGKVYQCLIRHQEAIDVFSTCLALDNTSKVCSYVYFRRAWSYKKLGQLDESCADFEFAKRLNPNNPNFCVDYKAIEGYEFIQVNSDPDLVSIFPPLWDRITF